MQEFKMNNEIKNSFLQIKNIDEPASSVLLDPSSVSESLQLKEFGQKTPKLKCKKCPMKFVTADELTVHEEAIHYEKCDICNEFFKTKKMLNLHLKIHNPKKESECPECGKKLNQSSLVMHRKIHENNPKFACTVCDKKFVQKVNFIQHSTFAHTQNRPHACEFCDKTFVMKSTLLRHENYVHSGSERNFECLKCGKKYKTKRCLVVHSLVHLPSRPYNCEICQKGFLSTSKLKQHTNIHTGKRPFICYYCPKDFTNYPNWHKHIRRRHKVDHRTGEKLENIPNYSKSSKKKVEAVQTATNRDEDFEIATSIIKEDLEDQKFQLPEFKSEFSHFNLLTPHSSIDGPNLGFYPTTDPNEFIVNMDPFERNQIFPQQSTNVFFN